MTNFIPIFPLEVIIYPGEPLNLHIFEPRYMQLIRDCIKDNRPFGLAVVMDKKIVEYGTLIEIKELAKEYESGEMDIRTTGVKVFRILEIIKEIPGKMYNGAIVTYPANVMEHGDSQISKILVNEVKRLCDLMGVAEKFPANKSALISYEIARYAGLSKQQEYELLELMSELHRLEYLRRHMTGTINPIIQDLEQLKARIQMNGHFRNLSSGDINM